MEERKIYLLIGIDFDSVAGWVGSYGGQDSVGDIQQGIFAAEVGVKRLLNLLKKLELKATWFCPGHSIESFPEQIEDIVSAGFEIGAHGYSHENPVKLTLEQEKNIFEKSINLIREATGRKPTGFVAPYWETTHRTSKILLENGFRYDHSQFHRDFDPYYMRVGEEWNKVDYAKDSSDWMKPLTKGTSVDIVEIPANWYLDDITPMMYMKNIANTMGFIPVSDVMNMWLDQFQWLEENSTSEVSVFPITLHPDASGRSHVLSHLEKMLLKITSYQLVENVDFQSFSEIYRKKFPYTRNL